MSERPGVPDLPERDPGVPRFVVLLAGLAIVATAWGVLRPTSAAPLSEPPEARPVEGGAGVEVESGGALFLREGCGACHPTAGPSTALGPTMAGILVRASQRVADPAYTGRAETPGDYLREAVLDHCVDIVGGYECVSVSDVGLRLSAEDVDRLVEFMARVPEAGGD